MDHVRGVDEFDAPRDQALVSRVDVRHLQIEDGLRARIVFRLRQHQSRPAAIEEYEIAERVQMVEPEHVAVPVFRRPGIGDGARYLADALV